ncbi:MAG: fibronectin type III domain-containing protein [Oscillospiraceae bacterium]|nr:fibronectin type III domain-containing protein [Oscillospiraceae bacterium]
MRKKRAIAFIAALSVCMSMTVPAFADEVPEQAPVEVVAEESSQPTDTAVEPAAEEAVAAEPVDSTEIAAEDTGVAEEASETPEDAGDVDVPVQADTVEVADQTEEPVEADVQTDAEQPAEQPEEAPVQDDIQQIPEETADVVDEEASVSVDMDQLEEEAVEELTDEEELDLFAAVPASPYVRATAGNGSATLTWDKISNATSYRIYVYFPSTGKYAHLATLDSPSVTTFTINNLTNGARYAFLVRAFNGNTGSYYSSADAVYVTPNAQVLKPNVTATAGNGYATLRWYAVTGATSYRIYVYYPSTGRYALLATTTGTSYTRYNLPNGARVGFLVRAFNGNTGSAYTSADVRYVTPHGALSKPSVTATAGNGYANLRWNAVSGATSYRIYVYYPSTGRYAYLATTTGTSYTRYNLPNGVRVGFLVRAFNGNDGSSYTSADVRYVTPYSSLARPSVTATAGNGTVYLRWNAVSGATSYRIYRYNSNGSYTHLITTTLTSYTMAGLTNGYRYGYLVRAFNGNNGSAYSSANVVYATPTNGTLTKPRPTTSVGYNYITLRWNSISGADYYKVYRYVNGTYQEYATTYGTTYTANGLVNGTRYGFLVRAFSNGGASSTYSTSDVVYATPGNSSLYKPTLYVSSGTNSAYLSWSSVSGAGSYGIFEYINGSYRQITTTYGTSYTVSGLTSGYRYGFVVRAYDSYNSGNYSSSDVVYVTINGGSVSTPTVYASAGAGSATVSWNSVPGATSYVVYKYVNGSYVTLGSVSGTSCRISGLSSNSTYGFAVRAYNGQFSNYSNVAYVTPY